MLLKLFEVFQLLYGCKTWTIRPDQIRSSRAAIFELGCRLDTLNAEIKRKIQKKF
jgi:hypothetical protein